MVYTVLQEKREGNYVFWYRLLYNYTMWPLSSQYYFVLSLISHKWNRNRVELLKWKNWNTHYGNYNMWEWSEIWLLHNDAYVVNTKGNKPWNKLDPLTYLLIQIFSIIHVLFTNGPLRVTECIICERIIVNIQNIQNYTIYMKD